MKKIVLIFGTRPNLIKGFPLVKLLKEKNIKLFLIHTGQHFDYNMNKIFFDQFNIELDFTFDIKSEKTISIDINEHHTIIDTIDFLINSDNLGKLGEIRDKLIDRLKKINPNLVIVFGDVTSTLAGALATKILGIKLAHIESGLRCFDLSMPEEINRILTDHITDYLFVTEKSGIINLYNENKYENVFFVGNTMIDTLKIFEKKAKTMNFCNKLKLNSKNFILFTIHRTSNVDNLYKLKEIFDDLIELSKKEIIVYPTHHRTKKNLTKINYFDKIYENKNIIILDPLGYLEFLSLEIDSKYVITDSGGVQEETTCLSIPCFTLRNNTERLTTLCENDGTSILIDKISDINFKNFENFKKKDFPELWDGKSCERIWNIMNKLKF